MFKFSSFASLVSAATIALFGFSGLVVAQSKDNYVEVGQNSRGDSILLDLSSIRGSRYTLFNRYGNELFEVSFRSSCTEKRLFITQTTIYSATGRTLTKDRDSTELSPIEVDSPAGVSMHIVCKKLGVPGY